MLERDVEKKVCDFAKKQGCLVYKFSSPARRGVPDRMFVSPSGEILFIEFKAPGKKPTKLQLKEMQKLKDHNIECYVCDDVEHGKDIILWFSM